MFPRRIESISQLRSQTHIEVPGPSVTDPFSIPLLIFTHISDIVGDYYPIPHLLNHPNWRVSLLVLCLLISLVSLLLPVNLSASFSNFSELIIISSRYRIFHLFLEKLAALGVEGIEKLTSVLNKYFDKLIETIHKHGGDIIKVTIYKEHPSRFYVY